MIWRWLRDLFQGRTPFGNPRAGAWPRIRREHLAKHPTCIVCGGTKLLEVHHIRPFHLHPELELDPLNLVTLCEDTKGGMTCHLAIGHLGSFRSYNVNVERDAQYIRDVVKSRPT